VTNNLLRKYKLLFVGCLHLLLVQEYCPPTILQILTKIILNTVQLCMVMPTWGNIGLGISSGTGLRCVHGTLLIILIITRSFTHTWAFAVVHGDAYPEVTMGWTLVQVLGSGVWHFMYTACDLYLSNRQVYSTSNWLV